MFLMQCACVAGILCSSLSAPAQAGGALPDSPQPQANVQTSAFAESQGTSPANADSTISGTVLDANGDVIQGARVQLSKSAPPGVLREMRSGVMGQFEFLDLEPGTYTVTDSADAMTTFAPKP